MTLSTWACSHYVPQMSIRDQLIRKAILALDEVAEQARKEPVAPTFAIRFALAFLHATGKGERWMHDNFWKEMQRPTPEREWCHRGTYVRTALNGIMLNAGIEPSIDELNAMQAVRERLAPEAVAQRRMAEAMREEARQQREAAAKKRQDRDCGWL